MICDLFMICDLGFIQIPFDISFIFLQKEVKQNEAENFCSDCNSFNRAVFCGFCRTNSGDTAWMIMSTALVMMMTPAGLALFYGGMSRYKNLLNTIAMTFVAYCPPAASESKRKMRLKDLTVQYMGKELLKLNKSVIT